MDPSREPISETKRDKVRSLFAILESEIAKKNPANVVYFVVDFLCKNYSQSLQGFADLWLASSELLQDRLQVVEFFKYYKIPTLIAAQFVKAGFDTLDTLCAIDQQGVQEIETFNEAKWLPGHKVRLLKLFADIVAKVRQFRIEREKLKQLARFSAGYCDHPTVITRTNLPLPPAPAVLGPNPMTLLQNQADRSYRIHPGQLQNCDLARAATAFPA